MKKAILVLRKEGQLYKGRVQKLGTTMTSDIPKAVHRLDRMMEQVESYLSIQTTGKGMDLAKAAESFAAALSSMSPKSTLDKLRARTPKPEQRQAAVGVTPGPDHSVNQPWGVGAVADWQSKALAGLSVDRVTPDPDHRLVIHPGVFQSPKLYLERVDPTGDDDSGWYVGPAGDEPAPAADVAYEALRVGDLIAARPDLADLLALPTGILAVLDPGGPTAVFDAVGVDIWAIALIKAGDESPPAEDAAGQHVAPTAG